MDFWPRYRTACAALAENRVKVSSNALSESASSYSIDSEKFIFKGFEMPKPVP